VAVTTVFSNHFKYALLTGAINMDTDVFKIILMQPTFSFDPGAHATLAMVTAYQLPPGSGYEQDTATLTKTAPVVEDDMQNEASIEWDDIQWTAVGGDIGYFSAAIIYDDTTVDKTVVGVIDLGADNQVPDGHMLALRDLTLAI